jgi:hypothetical protein
MAAKFLTVIFLAAVSLSGLAVTEASYAGRAGMGAMVETQLR